MGFMCSSVAIFEDSLDRIVLIESMMGLET